MNVYYDKDADPKALQGKKVAVIGYGSQGHAHAQNLKDSGVEVCVGLRQGSSSWQKAAGAGLTVKETLDAATWGDIVMVLVPDEVASVMYPGEIEPGLRARLQHPLQEDRPARERERVHGGAEGPRTLGAQ